MAKTNEKARKRERRRARIRARVRGTAARPRLSLFRSARHVYAQVVDDLSGKTLAAVHSKTIATEGTKEELAYEAGKELAKRAREKGIEAVVFDRGGYAYHGRVKRFAEGAREGGLVF